MGRALGCTDRDDAGADGHRVRTGFDYRNATSDSIRDRLYQADLDTGADLQRQIATKLREGPAIWRRIFNDDENEDPITAAELGPTSKGGKP